MLRTLAALSYDMIPRLANLRKGVYFDVGLQFDRSDMRTSCLFVDVTIEEER